jgi:hypothetical protein
LTKAYAQPEPLVSGTEYCGCSDWFYWRNIVRDACKESFRDDQYTSDVTVTRLFSDLLLTREEIETSLDANVSQSMAYTLVNDSEAAGLMSLLN